MIFELGINVRGKQCKGMKFKTLNGDRGKETAEEIVSFLRVAIKYECSMNGKITIKVTASKEKGFPLMVKLGFQLF